MQKIKNKRKEINVPGTHFSKATHAQIASGASFPLHKRPQTTIRNKINKFEIPPSVLSHAHAWL